MGTFSIWHWAIVLLLIGVPVVFAVGRQRSRHKILRFLWASVAG